jgi:hypothetical protein
MTHDRSRRFRAFMIAATLVVGGVTLSGGAQASTAAIGGSTDCGAAARVRPGTPAGGERNEVTAFDVARVNKEMLAARSADRATQGGIIPVTFHVITGPGGIGAMSNETIAKQIQVLNQGFAGVEAPGVAADTKFTFVLVSVQRWSNNTWFSGLDKPNVERQAKRETRFGGVSMLNVWSADIAAFGFATFPWNYRRSPNLDGVVIDYATVPGGSETNFNLGKTLTHEAGHWMGLWHTFQGGCTPTNDQVADTAAQSSSSTGCPEGRDSCSLPGLDPIHNYMDYSFDPCYNQFTPGQSARMQDAWTTFRSGQ